MAVGLVRTKTSVYIRRTKWASSSIFLPFGLISLFLYSSLHLILQLLQEYWVNYWPNHPEELVYKRSRIAPYSAVNGESFPAADVNTMETHSQAICRKWEISEQTALKSMSPSNIYTQEIKESCRRRNRKRVRARKDEEHQSFLTLLDRQTSELTE